MFSEHSALTQNICSSSSERPRKDPILPALEDEQGAPKGTHAWDDPLRNCQLSGSKSDSQVEHPEASSSGPSQNPVQPLLPLGHVCVSPSGPNLAWFLESLLKTGPLPGDALSPWARQKPSLMLPMVSKSSICCPTGLCYMAGINQGVCVSPRLEASPGQGSVLPRIEEARRRHCWACAE